MKNKYKVRWIVGSDGDHIEEEHLADGVELLPNGAAFFNMKEKATIRLSPTPGEDQRPQVDIVGFVSSFTSLKKV